MTINITFNVRPSKMWIGFEISIPNRSLVICPLPGIALTIAIASRKEKR